MSGAIRAGVVAVSCALHLCGTFAAAAGFETATSKIVGEHFVVLHPEQLRPEAVAAMRTLEEGRGLICGALGLAPDGAITVLLLTPAAFRAGTGDPPWVRGAYDGRILVPVEIPADEAGVNSFRAVLMHELTHALLRKTSAAKLPPWFEEGLAERFEGTTAAEAGSWLRRRRAPRFTGLDAIDAAIRSGGWSEDAGHQGARLAVQALEELAGVGAAKVLAAHRTGVEFSAALSAVVPGGRAAIEERLRLLLDAP